MLGAVLDDDYVIRMLRRVAEAVARAIKRGMGGKPEDVVLDLQAACGEVLGMEYRVLSMLDPRSAVELLGARERVLAFIQLLQAMAQQETGADAQARIEQAFHLAATLRERDGGRPEIEAVMHDLAARLGG